MAPSGNDGNSGRTAARPFATVGKAAQVARAGDVIDVRGGVYRVGATVWLGASGTASNRILLRSHPGERAVLDGSALGPGGVVVGVGGRYVDVQGFEIRGGAMAGISVWGGAHVRIVGNQVHGMHASGIVIGFDRPGVVTDVAVSGNTVWDNSTQNRGHAEGGGWGQGISALHNSSHVRVTHNRVFHTHGEGIGALGVRITVSDNVVYDNFAAGIYVDQATRSTIRRNVVYTTGDRGYYRFGMPSTALQIANEGHARPELLTGLSITDNVLIGGRSGIAYWSGYGVGGGLRDSVIAHNTVYGSASENLLVQADRGHRGTVIRDNIFFRRAGEKAADVAQRAGLSLQGNCWSVAPPGNARGAADVVARPTFVRPGGRSLGDYRLAGGSRCAGKGARL